MLINNRKQFAFETTRLHKTASPKQLPSLIISSEWFEQLLKQFSYLIYMFLKKILSIHFFKLYLNDVYCLSVNVYYR